MNERKTEKRKRRREGRRQNKDRSKRCCFSREEYIALAVKL